MTGSDRRVNARVPGFYIRVAVPHSVGWCPTFCKSMTGSYELLSQVEERVGAVRQPQQPFSRVFKHEVFHWEALGGEEAFVLCNRHRIRIRLLLIIQGGAQTLHSKVSYQINLNPRGRKGKAFN